MFLVHLLARAEARTQQERDCQRNTRDQGEQRKGQWAGSAHRGHDAIDEQDKDQRAWRHSEYRTEDEMPEPDMRRTRDQVDDGKGRDRQHANHNDGDQTALGDPAGELVDALARNPPHSRPSELAAEIVDEYRTQRLADERISESQHRPEDE